MRSPFLVLCLGAFVLMHSGHLQAQVWTEPLPIMDLAGAGDFIIAATQGGVIRWQRSLPDPQVVTTADGLPTQVVLSAGLNPLNNELLVTTPNGAARGWFSGSWTTLGALPDESGSSYSSSLVLPKGGWVLGGDRGKLVAWHGMRIDSLQVPTNTGRVIALAFLPGWVQDGDPLVRPAGRRGQHQRNEPKPAAPGQLPPLFPNGLVVTLDNDGVWLLRNSAKAEWLRLDARDSLPFDFILDAVADALGNLWVASRDGIARIKQPGVIETFPNDPILSQRANVLFSAPGGLLYIGLPGGLAHVDPATDPPLSTMTQWTNRPVTSIASNDDGLWWTDGYAVRSAVGVELAVPLSVADGHGLSVVAHGDTMWVGHPFGRLSRFTGGAWTRFGTEDGLPSSDLYSFTLFDGLLRVGTSHGVYVEERFGGESRFRVMGDGPVGIVRALAVRDGVLIAGSSAGLWEYGDFGWRRLPLWPGASEVQSLVAADVLWASAGVDGVAFHNQHGWHSVAVDSELSGSFFGAMQRHDDGRIAVGTDHGVALWDGGVLHCAPGGPTEFVHAVQWWGDTLAVGTNSGLWIRRADGAWVWRGIFEGLAGTKVRALAQGQEGRLWIASTRGISLMPRLDPTSYRIRRHASPRHHIASTTMTFRHANRPVRFDIPNPTTASRVRIYDIRGRLVRSLSGRAGQQSLRWDGRDASGRSVGQGVYFLRIQSSQTTQTHRFLWLR